MVGYGVRLATVPGRIVLGGYHLVLDDAVYTEIVKERMRRSMPADNRADAGAHDPDGICVALQECPNFKEATRRIWTDFLQDRTDVESFSPDCAIIGTGAHEIFRNREEFMKDLTDHAEERDNIRFEVRNFWCDEKAVAPQAVLTYGGMHVWWQSDDKRVVIDMDSRFTMLFRKEADGWKLVHVHHSVPDREQAREEYYPKNMAEQLRAEQERAERYKMLATRDELTGLYNFRQLKKSFRAIKKDGDWLFVADIDNFKNINDTYGHLAGDYILQEVARVFMESVRSEDVVCRLGGDEFVLICSGLSGEKAAAAFSQRLLHNLEQITPGNGEWYGLSLGGTPLRPGDTMESAVERADSALYAAKAAGKNTWNIAL
ncbi:MAG: diguanylate cyclase [Eubacteriales bacterium]|nr:diguanylate cyclase [Eubacteriales bacterium]